MQKDTSLNRHFKEVNKYFEKIEGRIPYEADPVKYEFYKQLIIEIERIKLRLRSDESRLRNTETILDGVVRKGKKFVKVPLPEEIEEGDGTQ